MSDLSQYPIIEVNVTNIVLNKAARWAGIIDLPAFYHRLSSFLIYLEDRVVTWEFDQMVFTLYNLINIWIIRGVKLKNNGLPKSKAYSLLYIRTVPADQHFCD